MIEKRKYEPIIPVKPPVIIDDDLLLKKYPFLKKNSPEFHYWKFCLTYQNDTVRFNRYILGNKFSSQQADLARALDQDDARVAVRSAHGTGKSFSSSVAALCFLVTHPFARIMVTSGTHATLESVFLPELSANFEKLKAKIPIFGDWFDIQNTQIKNKFTKNSFLRLRTTRKENTASLAGQHVQRGDQAGLLWVIEEASSLVDNPEILDVIKGSLTTGRHNKLLMIGNPTANYGFFYDAFHEKAKDYTALLHFSALEAPNSFCPIEEIKKDIENHGVSSRYVIIRRLGDFHEDASEFLLTRSVLNKLTIQTDERGKVITEFPDGDWKDVLTVDLAGKGSNESVVRHSQVIIEKGRVEWIKDISVEGYEDIEGMEFLYQVIRKSKGLNKCPIIYDRVGVGENWGSRARELKANVYEFVGGRRALNKKDYKNLRAEGYGNIQRLAEQVEQRIFILNDEKTLTQLAKIPYKHDEKAKLQIMKKEIMIDKYNIPSPDRADTFSMIPYAVRCKWDIDYDEEDYKPIEDTSMYNLGEDFEDDYELSEDGVNFEEMDSFEDIAALVS